MRAYRVPTLLLSLVVAAAAVGADAPIRVPVAPPVPQPMPPAPSPGGVLSLTGDALYVIDSKVECAVRAHPAGLVKVTKKKGPRDISAKFVDGTGFPEDRTYDGPFLYVVQASGKGRVELDIIPLGLKSEADIVTAAIDVDSGTGPIPPPKPPEPKPVDPPSPAKSLRVFLIFESGDSLTLSQRGVLYGRAVEDWLTANCTGGAKGWRRRDKDSPGEADPTFAALWAAVQPNVTTTPCIAVEVNNRVELINLEPTPAAMIAVLEKYKTGK